jgi:hypothetical protein
MIKKILKQFSTVRMQLVASVFVAIAPALVLTYLVNQKWFWEFAPGWLKQYALDVPWASFAVGLLALFAAWFGGEHFILRQVRALSAAAQRFTNLDSSQSFSTAWRKRSSSASASVKGRKKSSSIARSSKPPLPPSDNSR